MKTTSPGQLASKLRNLNTANGTIAQAAGMTEKLDAEVDLRLSELDDYWYELLRCHVALAIIRDETSNAAPNLDRIRQAVEDAELNRTVTRPVRPRTGPNPKETP